MCQKGTKVDSEGKRKPNLAQNQSNQSRIRSGGGGERGGQQLSTIKWKWKCNSSSIIKIAQNRRPAQPRLSLHFETIRSCPQENAHSPCSLAPFLPSLARLKDFYNCLSNLCSTWGNQFVGLSIDKRNFNAELNAQPFSRSLCVLGSSCCFLLLCCWRWLNAKNKGKTLKINKQKQKQEQQQQNSNNKFPKEVRTLKTKKTIANFALCVCAAAAATAASGRRRVRQ